MSLSWVPGTFDLAMTNFMGSFAIAPDIVTPASGLSDLLDAEAMDAGDESDGVAAPTRRRLRKRMDGDEPEDDRVSIVSDDEVRASCNAV